MSQEELFKIWAEEAKFVMKTQGSGDDALNIWKSIGKREVMIILSNDIPCLFVLRLQTLYLCLSLRFTLRVW